MCLSRITEVALCHSLKCSLYLKAKTATVGDLITLSQVLGDSCTSTVHLIARNLNSVALMMLIFIVYEVL